jgi:hypothetical protein
MATQADILQALRNADAAGDAEAATRLARLLRPEKPMPEMRSVPDDAVIDESPEFQAQEDPGILSRLFNPPGGIGEAGAPPLTSEEGKSLLGTVAATGGALAAPYLAVPAMLSKAKFLGPVASFFTKNAAKAGVSGVSGSTGETAADVVQGNEIDPSQMVETAAEYGAAELGGEVVSKVAGKVLAPAANKITEQAKKLLTFAKKENIPISAGVLVPGMTEKILQGSTDNFIPSRLVNQAYRGKLITRMNELMSEIPEGVGPVLGKEESSLITTEAFRAASNAKQANAKRLRNEFLETIGPSTVVPVKSTEALLKKISPQVKDPALREFIEVELASISKGAKSAEQLEQTLNQIGAIRAKGADKKYLTEIREAAQADFKDAGADMEKLSNSSNFFKMNSELLSNPTARRLMKENLTSQQMTAQIFRSGNEGFIKQLGKELPPQTWNSLRAQNLANLLENFSEQSDKMPGARILTKGDQLVKWIENNQSVLKEAYDPQTIEALENFAQLAKASKGETANYGRDMSNFGAMANLGALGGVGYTEPTSLAFTTATMPLIAMSMMKPDGIVKQWLTTGLKGAKTAGEAAKLGGRAIVAGEDDSN